MSSNKGSAGLGPAFAEVGRMKASGEWDTQRLYTATLKYQREELFPTALGRVYFERGDALRSVFALREARDRLMLKLEIDPNNREILEELQLTELDLAEAEAALPA